MTAVQRGRIKKKIIDDLASLQKEVALLMEKTAPISPDCSLGRLTRLEAMGEKEVNTHALHEAKIRINKLNYALQKIDDDEFGICAECGEEIPVARLMIVPESLRCVTCSNS